MEEARPVLVSVGGGNIPAVDVLLAQLPEGKDKTFLVDRTAEAIVILELKEGISYRLSTTATCINDAAWEIEQLRAGLKALGASIETEIKVARKRLEYRYSLELMQDAMRLVDGCLTL